MSALPAGGTLPEVLVPHWLSQGERALLSATVRDALAGPGVHPVAAIHLGDVLVELHVAAAREAVWPASAARVRMAAGWTEDVLPVRLSSAEVESLLTLPTLPPGLRARFGGNG